MTEKQVDGGYHDGDLEVDQEYQDSVRKINKEFFKKNNPDFHKLMERVQKENGTK